MKRIIAALSACILLAGAAILPAAAEEAAAPLLDENGKQVEINVYNWGEYISTGDDGSMDVNAEFTKRTGIKVNYTTFETNESLYAKLKSSGESYDVIIPSDYMIARMIKEDMLTPLDFSNIPNYAKIDERFKTDCPYDPENKYTVPYTYGQVGILYNDELVDDPVESWDILWNEKYKKQILMFSNWRDAFGIAQKRLGYSFNSTDEAQWEAAAEQLRQQKPLVQAYVMDQIFDKMASGEAALAPYYAGDALTIHSDNEHIQFAVPKEGTNLFVDAMCIPKNCGNKAAAEAYINFMCETDVAADNIAYISYASPQTEAAVLHAEYLQEEYGDWAVDIIYPEASGENDEIFAILPDDLNKKIENIWISIQGSSGGSLYIILTAVVVVLLAGGIVFFRVRKHMREKDL